MKPRHLTWLVTSAALSAALSATAQTQPGGAGAGTGSGQTQGSGAQGSGTMDDRTQGAGDTGTGDTGTGDTTRGTMPEDSSNPGEGATRDDDMGRPYDRDGSAEQPKKRKRSFWDRITGRNKHLDEENRDERDPREMEPGESPTETRPQP